MREWWAVQRGNVAVVGKARCCGYAMPVGTVRCGEWREAALSGAGKVARRRHEAAFTVRCRCAVVLQAGSCHLTHLSCGVAANRGLFFCSPLHRNLAPSRPRALTPYVPGDCSPRVTRNPRPWTSSPTTCAPGPTWESHTPTWENTTGERAVVGRIARMCVISARCCPLMPLRGHLVYPHCPLAPVPVPGPRSVLTRTWTVTCRKHLSKRTNAPSNPPLPPVYSPTLLARHYPHASAPLRAPPSSAP